MATKIAVALEDDLDGGRADETLQFAIGGSEYDLSWATFVRSCPAVHRPGAVTVSERRFGGVVKVDSPGVAVLEGIAEVHAE